MRSPRSLAVDLAVRDLTSVRDLPWALGDDGGHGALASVHPFLGDGLTDADARVYRVSIVRDSPNQPSEAPIGDCARPSRSARCPLSARRATEGSTLWSAARRGHGAVPRFGSGVARCRTGCQPARATAAQFSSHQRAATHGWRVACPWTRRPCARITPRISRQARSRRWRVRSRSGRSEATLSFGCVNVVSTATRL